MVIQDFRIDAGRLNDHDVDLAWDVIEPIWDLPIVEEGGPLPPEWSHVTSGQLAVFAVTQLEREVVRGGFERYFECPAGFFAREALDGFRRMGAQRYAELLARAMSVFPDGQPPRCRDERREVLDELLTDEMGEILDETTDRFFDAYDATGDGFYHYVERYIRANAEEFFK